MDKPLTLEIYTDPENPIVKSLLYIYTMETWLYPELNKASRNKDESKIMLLGPYSCALNAILGYCEVYGRTNDPERLGINERGCRKTT